MPEALLRMAATGADSGAGAADAQRARADSGSGGRGRADSGGSAGRRGGSGVEIGAAAAQRARRLSMGVEELDDAMQAAVAKYARERDKRLSVSGTDNEAVVVPAAAAAAPSPRPSVRPRVRRGSSGMEHTAEAAAAAEEALRRAQSMQPPPPPPRRTRRPSLVDSIKGWLTGSAHDEPRGVDRGDGGRGRRNEEDWGASENRRHAQRQRRRSVSLHAHGAGAIADLMGSGGGGGDSDSDGSDVSSRGGGSRRASIDASVVPAAGRGRSRRRSVDFSVDDGGEGEAARPARNRGRRSSVDFSVSEPTEEQAQPAGRSRRRSVDFAAGEDPVIEPPVHSSGRERRRSVDFAAGEDPMESPVHPSMGEDLPRPSPSKGRKRRGSLSDLAMMLDDGQDEMPEFPAMPAPQRRSPTAHSPHADPAHSPSFSGGSPASPSSPGGSKTRKGVVHGDLEDGVLAMVRPISGVAGGNTDMRVERAWEVRRGLRRRSSFDMDSMDLGDDSVGHTRQAIAAGRKRRSSLAEMLRHSRSHIDDFTGDVFESVSSLMVHPRSQMRRMWDRAMLVALVFQCIVVPFRIAYEQRLTPFEQGLYALIDVLFLVEVVLNFMTGQNDETGEVEMRPQMAVRLYAKSFLLPDLLIAAPLETLQLIAPSLAAGPGFAELKLLRLLRVPRVFLTRSDAAFASAWWLSTRSSFRLIVRFASIMLVAAHINACVYWYIASRAGLCGMSWVASQTVRSQPLCEADLVTQYITSLYWSVMTMSTTGYGRINATTEAEQTYCMFAMLFGSLMYFYFVLQVCNMVANNNIAQVWRRRYLDNVLEMLNKWRVKPDLTKRVREYYSYKRIATSDVHGERQLLSSLPQTLMKGVWAHASVSMRSTLARVSLFKDIAADPQNGDTWLIAISSLLRPQVHPPKDVVVYQGARGNKMYFVQSGKCETLVGNVDDLGCLRDVRKVGEFGPNGFFGEVALFSAEGRRTATIRTLTYVHLYSLDKRSLEVGLREHPEIMARIRDISRKREMEVQQASHSIVAERAERETHHLSFSPVANNGAGVAMAGGKAPQQQAWAAPPAAAAPQLAKPTPPTRPRGAGMRQDLRRLSLIGVQGGASPDPETPRASADSLNSDSGSPDNMTPVMTIDASLAPPMHPRVVAVARGEIGLHTPPLSGDEGGSGRESQQYHSVSESEGSASLEPALPRRPSAQSLASDDPVTPRAGALSSRPSAASLKGLHSEGSWVATSVADEESDDDLGIAVDAGDESESDGGLGDLAGDEGEEEDADLSFANHGEMSAAAAGIGAIDNH